MKRIIIILALALALVLASCGPVVQESDSNVQHINTDFRAITRHIDEEAGVACWVYYASSDGVAMDCMPLRDTRLETGR